MTFRGGGNLQPSNNKNFSTSSSLRASSQDSFLSIELYSEIDESVQHNIHKNMLNVFILITNCLFPKWRTKAGCRTSKLKGQAIQIWFGLEGGFSTHHEPLSCGAQKQDFILFFYRTGHKNVLHRHGMIPCGALFHYFL